MAGIISKILLLKQDATPKEIILLQRVTKGFKVPRIVMHWRIWVKDYRKYDKSKTGGGHDRNKTLSLVPRLHGVYVNLLLLSL